MTYLPESPPRVSSTEEIRASFPALDRRHGGLPVAYFDGPGGTQVPRGVAEAVADYLVHHNANAHWAFPTSSETDEVIAQARRSVADFLNAAPAEVVFGANMTTLTFHLARALGRRFGPGDEVVVTELDHHANVAPWHALAGERGITVRTARMDRETGRLDEDHLARQIGDRTRLVAIGAASNALGTINDVAAVVRQAHAADALAFVDAVHYAPHELVDVQAWDCDFLACSAYKFYGPHVGVLYGKREQLQELDVPKLAPAPEAAPERCETGTLNHEGLAGVRAAIDFLASLAEGTDRRERLRAAFGAFQARGSGLLQQAWAGLADIKSVQLHGPPPGARRTPTLSFTVGERPASDIARHLATRGLFASHGDFYATTVVQRLGRERQGLVRIGCACYTTVDEIQRLIAAVAETA